MRKHSSATIVADIKRFCYATKTDDVFGTHSTPKNVVGKLNAAAGGSLWHSSTPIVWRPAYYFVPMIASANHVAIPGKAHSTTTANIISATNGITPQTTSRKGISGAMFLMTKMFKPTGG
jgi:hypothetical protein